MKRSLWSDVKHPRGGHGSVGDGVFRSFHHCESLFGGVIFKKKSDLGWSSCTLLAAIVVLRATGKHPVQTPRRMPWIARFGGRRRGSSVIFVMHLCCREAFSAAFTSGICWSRMMSEFFFIAPRRHFRLDAAEPSPKSPPQ